MSGQIIIVKPKHFEAFLNAQEKKIKRYKKGKRKQGKAWKL